MRRETVKRAGLIFAAVCIGYLCYLMLESFLLPIIWSVILAIIVNPMFNRLRVYIKSPALASLISVFATLFIVVIPIALMVVLVARTVLGILNNTVLADSADPEAISHWVNAQAAIITQWISDKLGIQQLDVATFDLKQAVVQVLGFLAGQSQRLIGGVAGFLFNLLLVLITLFFILRDRDAIIRGLKALLPLNEHSAATVFRRVEDVIRASVVGGGAVAVVQGILAMLGYWVLGVPSPILWGFVTAFTSFIPFVGAAGVWIPAAAYLYFTGSPIKALILVAWGAFGISLVDNIIRPIIVGDRTRVPTLLLLFSILGGLKVFGFLGIIMGPVVLVIMLALIDVFRLEMHETDEERKRATGDLGGGPPPESVVAT